MLESSKGSKDRREKITEQLTEAEPRLSNLITKTKELQAEVSKATYFFIYLAFYSYRIGLNSYCCVCITYSISFDNRFLQNFQRGIKIDQ